MTEADDDFNCSCGQSFFDHPDECEVSVAAKAIVDRAELKVIQESWDAT